MKQAFRGHLWAVCQVEFLVNCRSSNWIMHPDLTTDLHFLVTLKKRCLVAVQPPVINVSWAVSIVNGFYQSRQFADCLENWVSFLWVVYTLKSYSSMIAQNFNANKVVHVQIGCGFLFFDVIFHGNQDSPKFSFDIGRLSVSFCFSLAGTTLIKSRYLGFLA